MRWEYAVTTVPSRVYTTLPRTLQSLLYAGFPSPRICVDGRLDLIPRWFDQYKVTRHEEPVFAYGNWVLALQQMIIASPDCDRYAIFQDDILLSMHARQYLEMCPWPGKCYLNMITYPSNHPGTEGLPERKDDGWYASRQNGKGAQALIFDRESATALLTSKRFFERRFNLEIDHRGRRRGRVNIDGGICDALGELGFTEYVHWPSLVGHQDEVPSAIGNPAQPKIGSWRGEGFDAMACLAK